MRSANTTRSRASSEVSIHLFVVKVRFLPDVANLAWAGLAAAATLRRALSESSVFSVAVFRP